MKTEKVWQENEAVYKLKYDGFSKAETKSNCLAQEVWLLEVVVLTLLHKAN